MLSNDTKYNLNIAIPWKELGLLAVVISVIALISMLSPAVLGSTPILK